MTSNEPRDLSDEERDQRRPRAGPVRGGDDRDRSVRAGAGDVAIRSKVHDQLHRKRDQRGRGQPAAARAGRAQLGQRQERHHAVRDAGESAVDPDRRLDRPDRATDDDQQCREQMDREPRRPLLDDAAHDRQYGHVAQQMRPGEVDEVPGRETPQLTVADRVPVEHEPLC